MRRQSVKHAPPPRTVRKPRQEDDGYAGAFIDFLVELDAAPLSDAERRAVAAARAARARADAEVDAIAGDEAALAADPDAARLAAAEADGDGEELIAEEIVAADPSKEVVIPADLSSAYAEEGLPYLALGGGDDGSGGASDVVLGPELLLSALEACGVDNAR